ncbi:MAG: ABC transporter permease subunit [Bacteroidales bacterium]|nr:ABC transporter permease subunit [Bacteroidales bacterium]
MLGIIILKEIQNHLYSLRFHISFIIVLLLFGIGTPGVITALKAEQDLYIEFQENRVEEIKHLASDNLTRLATHRFDHHFAPRSNRIISDCHEKVLPNEITYSAYNVFGFNVSLGTVNPLLKNVQTLSWSFIVVIILSFLTMLFAFDAISGEKEQKTLALSLSNSVSKGTLLFSKFVSIVGIITLIEFVGMMISMIIILIIGNISLDINFLFECLGFLLLSVLYISCFTVFGLLASIVTKDSNVSLLISLCFWLLFVIVIPNTSIFWAKKLFPIDSAAVVNNRIKQEREELSKNAPPGSWSSQGNNPFYPRHELRANLQMSFLMNEKKHRDAYYVEMMSQFEKTRNFTLVSPVALFDYSTEAFLGGGYLRFKKNWENLSGFQEQFLSFFKEADAADEESPHWYNPYERYSTTRKPVSFEEVPVYTEQIAPFDERLEFMLKYVIILIIYTGAIFSLCFVLFMKYDAR